MVELLIANGADVNARDDGGLAPLDEAARRGHKDIIELLAAKTAGVNTKAKRD